MFHITAQCIKSYPVISRYEEKEDEVWGIGGGGALEVYLSGCSGESESESVFGGRRRK